MKYTPTFGIIFGAISGYAIAGFMGIFLGMMLGGVIDYTVVLLYMKIPYRRVFEQAYANQASFFSHFPEEVIVVAAKLAKVDGHISKTEIATFKQIFRISPDEVKKIGKIFNTAGRSSGGYETHARRIRQYFSHDPKRLEIVLHAYFAIALCEGRLVQKQIEFLREVAYWFALDETVWQRISRHYLGHATGSFEDDLRARPAPLNAAYGILGLGAGDSDKTIKERYKKLVRDLHPDRVSSMGKSAKEIKQASDELAKVNAAYDEIRKERKFR